MPVQVGLAPDDVLRVATPEDVILQKLRCYRMGGESSERQWRDVRGVAKAAGTRFDRGYLDAWAVRLGIGDLLDRLWAESGAG